MRRILYLDPWSGAAGDMIVAALVEAAPPGVDARGVLDEAVRALGLPDLEVQVEKVAEHGLSAGRLHVRSQAAPPLRHLSALERILDESCLAPAVAERARAALRRLAGVEAAIHGVGIDSVHFHEIGAVDTLVDVVGAFALVHALDIGEAYHSPPPLGFGEIHTEHGVLCAPAPAVLTLLEGRSASGGDIEGEMTTPTGALLLTEIAAPAASLPSMKIEASGFGAGSRSLPDRPNVLRAVVGSIVTAQEDDRGRSAGGEVVVLEAAIDDATPEVLAHAQKALLSAGALDTWCTPIVMKKGRPGVDLAVLAPVEQESGIVDLLFAESTTFGIRRTIAGRHVLERGLITVDVGREQVRVKVGSWKGKVVTLSPEYEDAAAAAGRLGRPLKDVMAEAAAAARLKLVPGSSSL